MSVASLLQMYGNNLDIVYPDGSQPLGSAGYHSLVYWNDTRLIPTQSPTLQQGSSLPFYESTVWLSVIAAGILVAVAVAFTVLKFRKGRR